MSCATTWLGWHASGRASMVASGECRSFVGEQNRRMACKASLARTRAKNYAALGVAFRRLANASPCAQRCCSSAALSTNDSTWSMTRQYRDCVPRAWSSYALSERPSRRTMPGKDRSMAPGLSPRTMRPVSSTSFKYSTSLTPHDGPLPATGCSSQLLKNRPHCIQRFADDEFRTTFHSLKVARPRIDGSRLIAQHNALRARA